MPRKVFVSGEILTASDVNTQLMDQSVMVFDDASARTTAIPNPVEGMVTYLQDTNLVQAFTGSAFTPVGKISQFFSATRLTQFATSSTTFVDITDLSVTITPTSATSQMFLFFNSGLVTNSNADTTMIFRFFGNTIATPTARRNQLSGSQETVTNAMVDSPGSTSAVTYTVQMNTSAGSGRASFNVFTVMEVAG